MMSVATRMPTPIARSVMTVLGLFLSRVELCWSSPIFDSGRAGGMGGRVRGRRNAASGS